MNVFSYIGPFGKGRIYLVGNHKKTFKGEDYDKLIKTSVIDDIKEQFQSRFIYMQDNATVHKDETTNYIRNLEEIIEVVNWPARSPDLNPIENCWAILKKEVKKQIKNKKVRNYNVMFSHVKKAWNSIDNRTILKIYESFENRLVECLKRKGDVTKY